MKSKALSVIFVFLSACIGFSQETWKNMDYSFGFGRIGIANTNLGENSAFNPFILFEFTYSRSLYRFIGIKTSLGHSSHWIYTRAAFHSVGNNIELGEQADSRLNTYLRSNTIRLGVGPQFRLFRDETKGVFLSTTYIPSYNYIQRLQYKVSGDSKTYGEDLASGIHALRHILQMDLKVIHDRNKTIGFSTLTFFGGIDLNGYSSDNKFRPTYLGLMFGI